MIKEFALTINGEGFYLYDYSYAEAIDTFKQTCEEYTRTTNEFYRKYWQKHIMQIKRKDYIIIENTDFKGIRKIIY